MSSSSSTTKATPQTYGLGMALFVSCQGGLESLLAGELQSLGVPILEISHHGVYVPRDMQWVYRINYLSRLATRVLWPLLHFRCKDRNDLYEAARTIRWTDYLTPDNTFAIDANVQHPLLKNSLFAAQVVKDALCDKIREKYQARPSVNVHSPDVEFSLFIQKGCATISYDTSGSPLYKRGWRKASVFAPLQETLAAALLQFSGYTAEEILCDPFCGSGTLLIEAAMQATQTPAGFYRTNWGFLKSPEFSLTEWSACKAEADSRRLPLRRKKILGSDHDKAALVSCRANLAAVGLLDSIDLQHKPLERYSPLPFPTLVVTNPPYGRRIAFSASAYEELARFPRIAIIAPPSVLPAIAVPVKLSLSLFNGGIKTNFFLLS